MEQFYRSSPDERRNLGLPLAVAASAAWVIGLGAILCDFFEVPAPLVLAARFLFASTTCTTICCALLPLDEALTDARPAEIRHLARLVSRWTYILIYSLALVRTALYFSALCGAVQEPARSLDDFQFYIAAGVTPLWVIRAVVLRTLPAS